MKNKINKQQLIKMYTKKSDIRQGYIEVLKTVGIVTIIVSFVLIKFNVGKLEIFLLTILTFFYFFL